MPKPTFALSFLVMPFLATLLALTTNVQAKVYKWVTKDGTVVYSDQPHPDAEILNIEPLHPYKAPEYKQQDPTQHNQSQANVEATTRYSSVTIDSPDHDSNIHGSAGSFSVSVNSNPNLKKGDKYQLLIDGSPTGDPTNQTQFSVQNIDRGEHTVSVQILNKQGQSLSQSPSITVHIHRSQAPRKSSR